MCEPFVEEEFDEICQFLREKVWKGLEAFNPSRVRTTSKYSPDEQLERFVNSCVQNGKKDVLKKKRRDWLYIADMLAEGPTSDVNFVGKLHDAFENRYLREDDTFTEFPPDPDLPIIPSILAPREREVALMLYLDYKIDEIAAELDTNRKGVNGMIDSIRGKMVEWAPAPAARPLALAA